NRPVRLSPRIPGSKRRARPVAARPFTLILQQVDEQRVRDQESRLCQARALAVDDQMSGLLPFLDPTGQRCLAGGPLGQPRLRNAIARTQSENEPLSQLLARRQALGGLHGQRPAPDRGAPACERLDVAPAHVADEATRAGTGGEVLADAPVTEVVA